MDREELREYFKSLDDYYLYKIVNINSEDYVEESLNLAKEEYQRRNISKESEEGFTKGYKNKKEKEYIRDHTPLSWFQRTICFVFCEAGFCLGIYHLIKGYRRLQAQQAWTALAYGVLFRIIIVKSINILYRIDYFRNIIDSIVK